LTAALRKRSDLSSGDEDELRDGVVDLRDPEILKGSLIGTIFNGKRK